MRDILRKEKKKVIVHEKHIQNYYTFYWRGEMNIYRAKWHQRLREKGITVLL